MKILMALIATVVLSVHTGVQAADTDAQQAIDAAKAAHKKADSLQGGWVSTDKLIKKAEEASAKGDGDKALKLAKKAQKEAELAHAQAEYELKNWAPPPYLMPK